MLQNAFWAVFLRPKTGMYSKNVIKYSTRVLGLEHVSLHFTTLLNAKMKKGESLGAIAAIVKGIV